MNPNALCKQLCGAFAAALRDIDLRERISSALSDAAQAQSIEVLAVGKAAPIMLDGALERFGHRVRRALVITTDGTACDRSNERIEVLRASHPTPDHRSALAASAAVGLASSCSSELLLVLVSGGASSLLCAPLGASVDDFRALTGQLLGAGATIFEANVVRRHLSAVHGGRLAAASRAQVRTLIVSDVIGGAAHDVGSGPASIDPTTTRNAEQVLRRYLPGEQAAFWTAHLRETPKPDSALSSRVSSRIIAGPEDLAGAMALRLGVLGFSCNVETLADASADDLALKLIRTARELEPNEARVVSCEPTLRLPRTPGAGGRAGWVALRALRQLPKDTALLAGASDGVDGSSGAGGACVSAEHAAAADEQHVSRALDARDDAAVHRALGTHLPGVPTGLNLTDIYVVVRG